MRKLHQTTLFTQSLWISGPELQQEIFHLLVRVIPGLLEAPHVVPAAGAVGVGPRLQQDPHNLQVPLLHSTQQRVYPILRLMQNEPVST